MSRPGRPTRTERTADRLHSAAVHLLRALRREDAATGVGPARLSALAVLVFGGPRTLGELAGAEQVRPATMTRIVAGLEREGLARRQADTDDGRVARVRATPAGRRVLMRGRRRRVAALARRLERLPAGALARLEDAARLFERLAAP
jgi:DNA-binding MarR family transcriptional regulator